MPDTPSTQFVLYLRERSGREEQRSAKDQGGSRLETPRDNDAANGTVRSVEGRIIMIALAVRGMPQTIEVRS